MGRGRESSKGWGATFAAGLFMVHAILLGFSLGAHAKPVETDRFGNVLCVTADERSGGPDGGGHSGKPDCCAIGCVMAGAHFVPPPADASVFAGRPLVRNVPFVLPADVGPGAVDTPRSARAPPLSI